MGNVTSPDWLGFDELVNTQSKILVCVYNKEGKYLYVSPSSEYILGFTPTEFKELRLEDLLHKEGIYKGEKRINFFEKNLNSHFELRFLTKSKKWIWLQFLVQRVKNVSGSECYYLTATDVTEDRKRREELERYKRLFEQANHIAKVGAWEIDLETSETLWTDETYNIYDLDKSTTPTLDFLNSFTQPSNKFLFQSQQKLVMEGGEYDFEIPISTSKDKEKWIRTFGKLIERENKQPLLVGAIQDITEGKRKEEKIRQQYNDLKDLSFSLSKQNKQLLEFSYIISHNLRGPVGNLVTLSNFLKESEDENELEVIKEQIYESARILNQTFDELTNVLKIRDKSNIDIVNVDIAKLIDKSLKLFEPTFKEMKASVKVNFEVFNEISFSPSYLESIVMNLVSNAIKYRNTSKNLKLSIFSGINDVGESFICFKDNGLGINLQRFGKKMFQLHKTFHKNSEGRGVGLFLSKNQVEALGGDLRVESELGKGSSFYLIFNPKTKQEEAIESEA